MATVRRDGIPEGIPLDPAVVPRDVLFDLTSDANNLYIGTAPQGSTASQSVWTIKKVALSSGSPTSITYAFGIWNNRSTLTYS